jgi:hypothetical protein
MPLELELPLEDTLMEHWLYSGLACVLAYGIGWSNGSNSGWQEAFRWHAKHPKTKETLYSNVSRDRAREELANRLFRGDLAAAAAPVAKPDSILA